MSTQPVQLQIQVLGAQAIAQINAMAAALRGLPGGSGGVNVALNFQPLTNAINQLLAALNANTNAINNPPRPPAPAGPAPTGYGGAPVTINAPGRMINNPAAMNALVQSQFVGNQTATANKAQMQNLQAQMFDVLTQLGGGASPMLIMIQQGPQVIQALGGIGDALELLRAKLAAWKISMQGMVAILGVLGAALVAGALVYRYYARETERVLAQRERDHALARALLPAYRQLEDAQVKLAEATGQLSAQEAAAQRIRIQAGRSVVDFAAALRDQRKELYEQIVAGEKWMTWQRQFAQGLALVTFLQRAATDSTIDLSREGLQQHAKDIEDALDSVTNWRGSIEDARKALADMSRAEVENARNARATREALVSADAATRANADARKGAAEAAAKLREQEQALTKLHELMAGIMGDGTDRTTEAGRITAEYADKLREVEDAASAAGASFSEILPVVNRLNERMKLELDNLAEHQRRAAAAAQEAVMGMADALARGPEVLTPAQKVLADYNKQVYELVHAANEAGVALDDIQPQLASAEARFRADLQQAATRSAAGTASAVAAAIGDPLAALAKADPAGITAAVVAGIQAAARLPETLDSLKGLFSAAAQGLAEGGPAIGKFVSDLVVEVIPAMIRGALTLVDSLLTDGLATMIEGFARALPKLIALTLEVMITLIPRAAYAVTKTLLDPQTWIAAGKAFGKGFMETITELLRALRDIVEKVLPGKQFGTERTGLFSGGGVFDTLERYTTGAIFGRADRTGLFQSEGWFADAADALSGMGRRRRRSGGGGASSDREAVVNYNFAGAALMIGADPVRALDMSRAQYDRLYRSPVT